ncbi:7239_t:CDS:10 [Diversispora eburnea]|uniref:7239_t:CDS:1 n=1 Tax=Diversispora eburnea TaxID=1213867 RepID=A0A9N8WT69_9GLOM|nr:7239_t:CDS:10 [Diversispora eburnea]
MDKRLSLIELLEDFSSSQNDTGQTRKILIERCTNASKIELEEFTNDLSGLLCNSPDDYLSFFQYLYDDSTRHNKWLPNFASMLINNAIVPNLKHSDIHSFGLILYYCIEFLWRVRNDNSNLASQTLKRVIHAIISEDGVLGILISGAPGRRCFKRVLFDFELSNQIERDELIKAVDIIMTLVEKCYDHKDISPRLSEVFPIYKACTALLKTLRTQHTELITKKDILPPTLQNMVKLENKEYRTKHGNDKHKATASNSNINLALSTQDEKHLTLLKIKFPQKLSNLSNFLREIEQRKINLFQDLMEFMPCTSCHNRALSNLYPDKYFWLMEQEMVEEDSGKASERLLCLPFEFNEDELGPWDILLSEDAIKDMRILDIETTDAIMKKLWYISSGKWEKFDLIRKVSSSHDIPVYEVEVSIPDNNNGPRIIWQIDYGFSVRRHSLFQHIKIWAITANQQQINSIIEKLEIVHQVYNTEFKNQCKLQQSSKIGVFLPMCFGDVQGTKSIDDDPEMDDEKLLEVHKILITNKFFPLSKDLIRSLVLDGSDFTFQVSKTEYEIINSPTSAIIIGRSGTGKTTSIVFRQIASYLINQLSKTPSLNGHSKNFNKRQIFITVSDNLCDRVKEYFYKLLKAAELARKKISADESNEQVKKGEEFVIKKCAEIPDSFHQLNDDHFPLFITYDKFSKMLQGTYGIDAQKFIQKKHDAEDDDINKSEDEEFRHRSSLLNLPNASSASWYHFVDYDLFQTKYWPHFSDQHRKKLDCELVYSEFSVIKGTDPDVNFLSREDYRIISTRKYPLFRYNRDEIYDLFERYEKMKAKNDDYDSTDRTQAIFRYIKTKSLFEPHIHEVYIDECQDNKIVDLALILKLFDRADKIFMAGDIAQCIAQGSSFRFQDLRALIYKWEKNRIQTICNPLKPKQFELDTNYRSHNGILRLAASVIDLILQFFPDSIDKLKRERGEIGGPRPIIFEGFQSESFLFDVFSVGESTPEGIEFGADQAIIVRNKKTQDRLKNYGMVLTVFEAKGMEFNDVLLYNFFSDSDAGLKWRVVLSALSDYSKGIQTFSHEKHYILCSELKNLYVAVTRARQRLWIFDENAEYGESMKKYWVDQKLVQVIRKMIRSGEEVGAFSSLAKKSSPQEWDLQGEKFLARRQYELKIARESFIKSDVNNIKPNFISAAKAFIDCSKPTEAALCYKDIDMFKEAGDVCARWEMYEPAARYYTDAKMWLEAGDNFAKAKKCNEAVVAYKNGSLYSILIDFMLRDEIDGKIFRRISRLVNIHYRKKNDKEMSEKALSLLLEEERIEFLKDHAPKELLEFYTNEGQHHDAAEYYRERGKFKEAADMLSKDLSKEESIIESLKCHLHLCKVNVLVDTMNNKDALEELFNLLSNALNNVAKVKLQPLRKSLTEDFQLYKAYFMKDLKSVQKDLLIFQERNDTVNEFRALNIWLKISPQSGIECWHERLQHIMRLCRLSYNFIDPRKNVHNKEEINKEEINKIFEEVFFVEKVQDRPDKRKISSDNPLIYHINEMRDKNKIDYLEDWQVFNVDDVHRAISKFLASYIYELISKVDQEGRKIPEISSEICYEYINANCKWQSCRNHHVDPKPLILQNRVKLACLQYSVMRQLDTIYHRRLLTDENSKLVLGKQRFWAERLLTDHFRYQSPQSSCLEITYAAIKKLPKHTYSGLVKVLLHKDLNLSDFAQILKRIFVLFQLRCSWGIDKFHWETSFITYNSEPGFVYNYTGGYYESVARRLALFVEALRINRVITAIRHLKKFIYHSLDYSEEVNIIKYESFSDLTSLLEFTTFLILAARPGPCDFFIPQSYLVNYYDSFNLNPYLICLNSENKYKRITYDKAIKGLYYQAKKVLYIITKDFRKNLRNQIRIEKCNKYLLVTNRGQLVDILNNDLKENGYDSLVIVYHNWGGMYKSRFSSWMKSEITMISYYDIDDFRSSLQRITSEENVEPNAPNDQILFQPILNSPWAPEAASKIQIWFRRIEKKSRQSHPDPTLDFVYKEVKLFCQNTMNEEENKTVHKYNMLLMGSTVDTIVELLKLKDKMDKTKKRLKKIIDSSSDDQKIESCIELDDELKFIHNENVKSSLELLSINENSEQHKKANIEWLEYELQQAEEFIDSVWDWIEKCKKF